MPVSAVRPLAAGHSYGGVLGQRRTSRNKLYPPQSAEENVFLAFSSRYSRTPLLYRMQGCVKRNPSLFQGKVSTEADNTHRPWLLTRALREKQHDLSPPGAAH